MDPHPAGCSSRARMIKGGFCGRGRSSTAASSRQKRGEEVGLTEVGKGTKRMLVVDGNGIPLAPSISRAGRAEVKLAQETLERVRVPWRKRPERLVADKAYDCDRFRSWLRRKGVIPCIPPRRSRKGRRKRWADEFKGRWRVERGRSPGSATSGGRWPPGEAGHDA